MSMNALPPHFTGNNMMDTLKTNLITLMMFKSVNNNGNKAEGGSMFEIMYIF